MEMAGGDYDKRPMRGALNCSQRVVGGSSFETGTACAVRHGVKREGRGVAHQ